ncbi:MAG: ATP-binding cassette domain-containing protein [Bacteroidetes bacterium]|nr:ATP-binding cassette domain-containing protein [Bacteroidota bacterium]
MNIKAAGLGKRFNRTWIFRNLNYQFSSGVFYAITGPNGSGKSTLLQILSGSRTYNEGNLKYFDSMGEINSEKIFHHVSFAAPYLELIEEMTLLEFLQFHQKMKGFLSNLSTTEIISEIGLHRAANQEIRYFSSGMKQRVKLAQAIYSDTKLLLLDEPLTNLDDDGYSLYLTLINKYCNDRIVVISSNDKSEYAFCNEVLDIKLFKN